MNNRFRFRAWNKIKKIMHYGAEQTYDYMYGNPTINHSCFGDVIFDDDYIVEQCTGLKDKNGRLIYEGDIVKIEEDIGAIKWNYDLSRYEIETYDTTFDFDNYYGYELEVVGNIHENPEVLEAENGK